MTINDLLMIVKYKRKVNSNDTCYESILKIWNCNFNELKSNLTFLQSKGYQILKIK